MWGPKVRTWPPLGSRRFDSQPVLGLQWIHHSLTAAGKQPGSLGLLHWPNPKPEYCQEAPNTSFDGNKPVSYPPTVSNMCRVAGPHYVVTETLMYERTHEVCKWKGESPDTTHVPKVIGGENAIVPEKCWFTSNRGRKYLIIPWEFTSLWQR